MIDPTLQYKYISLLGEHLDGFKSLRSGIYNFRCPICGDSEKNSSKKRGYLFPKDGEYVFYCHNCGNSSSLKNFIKNVDSELYKEYQKDVLRFGRIKFDKKPITAKPWQFKKINLVSLKELDKEHPARVYVSSRNVPEEKLNGIKWCDDFRELIKNSMKDKYDVSKLPEKGIIFELKDLNGNVTGYQIRSIEKNCPKSQRFVICSSTEEHGFFYSELDMSKKIYIIEGCTDSLFLNNSIAVLSSALYRLHINDNCVYFNDQEPRNHEVCKQIAKCIDLGYKVVLLPTSEFEGMDVNDIVNSGVPYYELDKLFTKYTFSGIKAKLQFARWKK